MSNNYYYYAPFKDNGEAGTGIILLLIFGAISSFICKCFGSWENFFLVIGASAVFMIIMGVFIKIIQWLYKKRCQTLQKRYDAEQAHNPKEPDAPPAANWWEDDGEYYE